jgi:hypothetical protein
MLVKARCVVRGLNPWECFKMIYDFDVREQFETIFSEFEIVDRLNKYQDTVYMVIRVIFCSFNNNRLHGQSLLEISYRKGLGIRTTKGMTMFCTMYIPNTPSDQREMVLSELIRLSLGTR